MPAPGTLASQRAYWAPRLRAGGHRRSGQHEAVGRRRVAQGEFDDNGRQPRSRPSLPRSRRRRPILPPGHRPTPRCRGRRHVARSWCRSRCPMTLGHWELDWPKAAPRTRADTGQSGARRWSVSHPPPAISAGPMMPSTEDNRHLLVGAVGSAGRE